MKLEREKTAILTLDIQAGAIAMAAEMGLAAGCEKALPNAAKVVEYARRNGFALLHVGLGYEPGYPEISPNHPRFSMIRERGRFIKGSETAQFHPSIFRPGDTVVYKHRTSAFSGNALKMILQAKRIETLVFFGFATSGIVLSTIREAMDLDFQCVVIKDACFDRDEEVHRVLTEKVFTAQGTVLSANEFIALA